MEILRLVTLIYAGVLVLALAASLIAIWIWLLRIGRALGQVETVLAGAADKVRPLERYFDRFEECTDRAEEELESAGAAMEAADEALHRFAERLGAIEKKEAS